MTPSHKCPTLASIGRQGLNPLIFSALNVTVEQTAEKIVYFVIPSEARNLSFSSWAQTQERFLASLGMTKFLVFFPQPVKP
jgi:hypothetical protein